MEVDSRPFVGQISVMKTVQVSDFIRRFSSLRRDSWRVVRRGRIVGTWMPTMDKLPPVDFMKRLRKDFKTKLPFTGAELLKQGKRR